MCVCMRACAHVFLAVPLCVSVSACARARVFVSVSACECLCMRVCEHTISLGRSKLFARSVQVIHLKPLVINPAYQSV